MAREIREQSKPKSPSIRIAMMSSGSDAEYIGLIWAITASAMLHEAQPCTHTMHDDDTLLGMQSGCALGVLSRRDFEKESTSLA